jgi:hypothetical protein
MINLILISVRSIPRSLLRFRLACAEGFRYLVAVLRGCSLFSSNSLKGLLFPPIRSSEFKPQFGEAIYIL